MNKSGRQYDEGPPASIASGFEDQDGQENNTVNQVLAEDVNGSDQEFYSVSQILAERQFNGAIKYLVEWEDYSLHEATWEPPEHLEQDTISEWEEFKTTSGRRTARGFRVEDWKTAVQQHNQGERARQEELNRERLFNALEDFEEPDDQGVLFVDQKQAEPDPMAPTDEQGTLYALSGEHGLHHQEGATAKVDD
ncbi:hypothetical protein CDD83_3476 [Cordyceps sp. RAO-2017]|nr:hypothetical protein CDD83_3476 [Cordyceps sp. RAO-2017]